MIPATLMVHVASETTYKQRLYAMIQKEGTTMKFWDKYLHKKRLAEHIRQAKLYIQENYRDDSPRLICYKRTPVPGHTESNSNAKSADIKYSLRTPDVSADYYDWEKSQRSYESFSAHVLSIMDKKNLSSTEFYSRAGFDRKLFSKLKTDYTYQPAKITAIQCCLALHLNESEANALLQMAGYAFSNNNPFDLAIRYCIHNQIYKLDEVNELLLGVGVMPIC